MLFKEALDKYCELKSNVMSLSTLKEYNRGTIEKYTQKYNDMALQHFDKMQHEK